MSHPKDHSSGGLCKWGVMPGGSPGLRGSRAGWASSGAQENFSREGQIWSSPPLNAITVDLTAVRDKYSVVSSPPQKCRALKSNRGRRKPRREEKERRADRQVGFWESWWEGRRQGSSPLADAQAEERLEVPAAGAPRPPQPSH